MANTPLNSNKLTSLALICAISISFLIVINSLSSLTFCLISALVGIDFYQSARGFIKERTVIFCLYFFALYGYFSSIFWKETPIFYISVIFLGIGIGGIFYALCSGFFYVFCATSNVQTRKKLTIFMVFYPLFCLFLWIYVQYSSLICCLLLSFIGLIVCYILPNSLQAIPIYSQKEYKTHKKNRLKISLFFFMINLASSLIWAINSQNLTLHNTEPNNNMLLIGILTGSIITLLLVNKRGIYSGCVLLIFLAEIALMCTSLYSHTAYGPLLANLSDGLLLTTNLTLQPILIYYMLGPYNFLDNYAKILKLSIIGFLPVLPLSKLPLETLNSTEMTLATIFLLLGGFFTAFSAWSHRLVLLK